MIIPLLAGAELASDDAGLDDAALLAGAAEELEAAGDPEQDPVYGGTLSFTHETENARPDSITLDTVSGGS